MCWVAEIFKKLYEGMWYDPVHDMWFSGDMDEAMGVTDSNAKTRQDIWLMSKACRELLEFDIARYGRCLSYSQMKDLETARMIAEDALKALNDKSDD